MHAPSPTSSATPRAPVRFVNTFAPVAPFYEEVLPALERAGVPARALVAPSGYRGVTRDADERHYERLRLGFGGAGGKRASAVLYALEAPLPIALRRASAHVYLTQPPLFYLAGAAVSRATRTPYALHIMDFYPDILVPMGRLEKGGTLERALRRGSRWALRGARRVFVIGRCMRERAIRAGVAPERIRVLPNWGDRSLEERPKLDNPFRREAGLGDAFVVMYSGNMGASHELGTLLEVSERLRDRDDIRFVFVGRGVRRAEVERRVAAGQPNLRLFDYQPFETLPDSLSAADVHFISLRPGFEGHVVPSKFYGVLACGRPSLYEGAAGGEVARVVREAGCGEVIAPGDADALEASLLAYASDRSRLESHGAAARAVYRERYHPDVGAARYVDAVRDLVAAPSAAAATRSE